MASPKADGLSHQHAALAVIAMVKDSLTHRKRVRPWTSYHVFFAKSDPVQGPQHTDPAVFPIHIAQEITMQPFTEFYRRIGYNIYTSDSCDWCELQTGMLLAMPFHALIHPSQRELDGLLKRSRTLGLRYPTDSVSYGFISTRPMCRTIGYDLGTLSAKARNQVRKGQANFEIAAVPHDILHREGLSLNRQTLVRQGRQDPKADPTLWDRICRACSDSEGVEVWGAFRDRQLAAYLIVVECPDAVEIVIQNSDSEQLKLCPNNALTFHVTQYYLNRSQRPLPVSYGLGSLEATASLDHFKSNMGYTLEPIKQHLYFRPCARWLLGPGTEALLRLLARTVLPQNYAVRKSLGIVTCYRSQH